MSDPSFRFRLIPELFVYHICRLNKQPITSNFVQPLRKKRVILGVCFSLKIQGGGQGGDVQEALQFAARLSFRPGVVKTFVLVTCNASLSSSDYGDAMTMLTEQGIILHLVTPLRLRGGGAFGFTKTNVIRGSGLDQDPSLRRALKSPKELLTTLVQEVNGSVFDLEKLVQRQRQVKRASTAFSKVVADLSQPLACQVCDCLSGEDGRGRLMCHKCILPSLDIVLQNLAAD